MIAPTVSRVVIRQKWNPTLAMMKKAATPSVPQVLEAVGARTLARARSHTSRMNPPARGKTAWRPAHPEPLNWSDVRGVTAASYYYKVEETATGWRLEIGNTAETAVFLEARDGYAVVTGIVSAFVVPILIETAREVAPEWEVRLVAA